MALYITYWIGIVALILAAACCVQNVRQVWLDKELIPGWASVFTYISAVFASLMLCIAEIGVIILVFNGPSQRFITLPISLEHVIAYALIPIGIIVIGQFPARWRLEILRRKNWRSCRTDYIEYLSGKHEHEEEFLELMYRWWWRMSWFIWPLWPWYVLCCANKPVLKQILNNRGKK